MMSLQKGFLRPSVMLPGYKEVNFWRGIFMGCLFSIVLYFFLITGREALRIAFIIGDYSDLLVLTKKEIRFYDLFFSYYSCFLGLGVCIHFWLKYHKEFYRNRFDYLRRAILNNVSFVTITYTVWFIRCGSIYGLAITEFKLNYVFSMFPGYGFILIMLLVVLFFNQWLIIQRLYKKLTYKWILLSLLIILPSGFLLSKVKIVNYDGLNTALLKQTPEYYLKLDIPRVRSYSFLEKLSLCRFVYLGYPREKLSIDSNPAIYYNKKICSIDELISGLSHERSSLHKVEQMKFFIVLCIDKDVPLGYVDSLKKLLAEYSFQRTGIGVYRKEHKPPSRYTYIEQSFHLPPDYSDKSYKSFLKNLNLKEYGSSGELFYCLFGGHMNLLTIKDSDEDFIINGNYIHKQNLQKVLYHNLKPLKNCFIELICNEKTPFGEYIELADQVKSVLIKIRNEETMQIYHMKYRDLDWETRMSYSEEHQRFIIRFRIDYDKLIFDN